MGSFNDDYLMDMDKIFDSIDDFPSPTFSLVNSSNGDIDFLRAGSLFQEQESRKESSNKSYSIDFSQSGGTLDDQEFETEYPKKRGRPDASDKSKTKAYRERERREKLNESFLGLSSILQPGRTAKTDKLAILSDAIRVLSQLRSEAEEYKDENRKLQAEIECLKAEKNELREEKLLLKADKEKMEQQLKVMPVASPGLVPPPYPAAYPSGANKMALYPSYGMYPMWHYLPPATVDTSRDHELRPPAA